MYPETQRYQQDSPPRKFQNQTAKKFCEQTKFNREETKVSSLLFFCFLRIKNGMLAFCA